jgi:hypothetical protein
VSSLHLADGPARHRLRRLPRSIAVTAGVLVAAAFAAPAAPAGVGTSGPVDPDHGFPTWYDDLNGARLALCLDGPPLCLAGVPNPSEPASVPGNFEDEAFWWTAEAAIDQGGVSALLVMAQEAAFANGAPAPGDQMSFGRIRVRVSGLVPGGSYTVTHPYGTKTFTAEDAQQSINDTQDVGCVPVVLANLYCDFSLTRFSQVGAPFLRWDPAESAPPAGYIGDPNVEHTVVGSPTGNNVFQITGPGLPVGGLSTNRFAVQGKRAGPETAFSDARPRSLSLGQASVGTRGPAQTVTVRNGGTAPMTVSAVSLAGATPGDFALATNTCAGATLQPGQACAVGLVLAPGSAGPKSATLAVADNAAGGLRTVALSGTALPVAPPIVATPAAIPAVRVAGATASPAGRLVSRATVTRARLRRDGLRVALTVPAGARFVRISVFRLNGTRKAKRPIWVETRRVTKTGRYRAVLGNRTLIRRLRPGRYQIEVRTGRTRATLSRPVTTRIRVIR